MATVAVRGTRMSKVIERALTERGTGEGSEDGMRQGHMRNDHLITIAWWANQTLMMIIIITTTKAII